MAQLKEGSIIKKPTGDEVIATVKDIPTDLSQLIQDENNRLVTQTDIDRLRGMSIDLFMTEAQYEALSTEAKNIPLTIYNFIEEV